MAYDNGGSIIVSGVSSTSATDPSSSGHASSATGHLAGAGTSSLAYTGTGVTILGMHFQVVQLAILGAIVVLAGVIMLLVGRYAGGAAHK